MGLALLAGLACQTPPPGPYLPDRSDYIEFRLRHPELLDPNYLPFMLHRVAAPEGQGEWLVVCRWPRDAMPLRVHVRPPQIPDDLQDEFAPKDPGEYVAAVEDALNMWERELEGLVRFERSGASQAALSLMLVPEQAPEPEPDLQVLGRTPVARGCRVRGYDSAGERAEVEFSVSELRIYIADRFGLLDAEQVEWIALHEIGHALGMRGHSPIPADLMYEVVRDRVIVRELSTEDVNSFVSLYQLPNGALFRRLPPGPSGSRSPAEPPAGAPRLELAPHVDPQRGFSWRPPAGWLRVETARGVVAVDGLTWDYTASFQVIVQRYPTIEAYLERYAAWYLGGRRVLESAPTTVSGCRALRAVVEDVERGFVEHLVFVESGDGRVVVVVADAPLEMAEAYRPWFDAALASLRIWEADDPEPAQR
jgi:predicted Zn-dependent protease